MQLPSCVVAKHRFPLGQQLPFPLADLNGMQIILAVNFIKRLRPLGRFQGDFELELIAMLSTFLGPTNSSPGFLGQYS